MNELKFTKKDIVAAPNDEWEILIVDDEKEVHTITKAVLSKIVYDNKSLKFYHAFGEEEAIQMVKDNSNIALILLDVVMESSESGLNVVKAVREKLQNKSTRIILRTGQPGSAPQKDIILNYDINDYKEKTELTATKLFTSVITALRSFKEITLIQSNKIGLEQIIVSNTIIYAQETFHEMIDNILIQLNDILNIGEKEQLSNQKMCFTVFADNQFKIIHSSDESNTTEVIDTMHMEQLFNKALQNKKNILF